MNCVSCKWLFEEACVNDQSKFYGDYPAETDCCEYWEEVKENENV